ncbi:hypothetical protein CASFOL_015666 [Castilleja foliolosa]|uniref:Uncharacterized protein n=1 Tax=Castilleja foliolosa TaxID=1961234 RepID=A0ABD3DEY1_9LAMI
MLELISSSGGVAPGPASSAEYVADAPASAPAYF